MKKNDVFIITVLRYLLVTVSLVLLADPPIDASTAVRIVVAGLFITIAIISGDY